MSSLRKVPWEMERPVAAVMAAIAMRPLMSSARGVSPMRRCCWYFTGPYSMADSFVLSSIRSLTTRSETGRPSLISCSTKCKY